MFKVPLNPFSHAKSLFERQVQLACDHFFPLKIINVEVGEVIWKSKSKFDMVFYPGGTQHVKT